MNFTYFRQIYDYRELIATLAAKEIKIRYKSAVLGWLWSILHPLLLMIIFSVIFTFIIKVGIEKFPVFLLSALLPWFFFSLSLSNCTTSIVENSNLIKKAYFPQEVIPISVIVANLFNFLISMGLFVFFLYCFNIGPTVYILYLPIVILFEFIFILGICLVACAFHTMFRDVKYAIELLLIGWFYATPIFYPLSFVPESFRFLFYLNPLSLFVTLYRDILLYQKAPNLILFSGVALLSLAFCFLGIFVFSRYKKLFVDVT